jgi:hypothetical protein
MYLIGIDCATREEKTGLALYRPHGQLRELRRATPGEAAAGLLSRWISARPGEPFLLCMDAPLGWPVSFGRALSRHSAGELIAAPRDHFFQRAADLCVRRLLGKRPLEVTANFIARTAYRALELLAEVREQCGREIPVFCRDITPVGAEGGCIETYPAGWLTVRERESRATAARSRDERRRRMILHAEHALRLAPGTLSERSEHEIDAAVCCAAGLDFLNGAAVPPAMAGVDERTAEKEGWIWLALPLPESGGEGAERRGHG